jgi:hypothetical protein
MLSLLARVAIRAAFGRSGARPRTFDGDIDD